jgi:hypothetical protein
MENNLVSALSGLAGVVLGVGLTHFSNWIEDNRSENKKMSKKIYYRILPKLKYFFLNDDVSAKPTFSESEVKELKKKIENILEENIDFLDRELYSVYCNDLKSDKYYENLGYSLFIGINHLETFAKILSCMYSTIRKQSIINNKILKDVDELKYCYKTWFLLMEKFQNWFFVDNILQGKSLYKRTFKEIYEKRLIHKLLHCETIEDNEFYDVFSKYCFGEIDLTENHLINKKEKVQSEKSTR